MGHLYPTNISKYLIYKLFTNWFDKDKRNKGLVVSKEILDSPKPLKKEDAINHFRKNQKRMEFAISIVKKDDSTIFQEGIVEQEKTIKLLETLMEKNFGVSCADGLEINEWALDMAIQECLAIWLDHGIVEVINDEWFLKREIFSGNRKLDDSIIDEIVALLKAKKIDETIVKYAYYSLKEVGKIDNYIITYIDM